MDKELHYFHFPYGGSRTKRRDIIGIRSIEPRVLI